ncbi:MAG: YicC family protein [Clostridiales bacterium]|nr:YicC family protein [Clostridiales bacterium]
MRSMTGCGSGKVQQDGWEVTVDLKTVNHRFLDIGMRLPRNLSFLEQTVRDGLGKKISRGHADVFLTVKRTDASAADVVCDEELAGRYLEAAEQIARKTGVVNDLTVSRLMKMEGVLTLNEREMDEKLVAAICAEATEIAAAQLVQMREREGAHLKEDLTVHLDAADALRTLILKRAPAVVDEYREKLETRLKNLLTESVEPQRLAQEVAIIADRCAIDEELARLNSHIRQMRKYLNSENEIGKKMDFLIQEMNREANTIGSKASDAAIAQYVVDLKSEIEKLREQIQNVE